MSTASNLPAPFTSFIGREREIAQVVELLGATRVLTLAGPGGAGKTRLAIRVAADLQHTFPDGVCFAALALVRDPALVAPVIAQALAIGESGGQPLLECLIAHLGTKRLLLILDNFEQVLAAAPLLAELLAAAPGVKALITSRAPLRLSGEQEFPMPPLALPDPHQPEQAAQSEAVQLFVARARSAKPDFTLTAANAGAVAAICRQLDGLPLAIELAAARIKLLPPAALLARLDRRLPLLTGGASNAPARHQTLRDSIAWSYDLLEPAEQRLFRRLGVFVGGFTPESAEAVASELRIENEQLKIENAEQAILNSQFSILNSLASLVDQSLLRPVDTQDAPRFEMLETIREYAMERLAAEGEEAELRRRHAAFFLRLAEQAEQALTGPQQDAWLGRLDAEHANLRAALAWSLGTEHQEPRLDNWNKEPPRGYPTKNKELRTTDNGQRTEGGLRLAVALCRFWYIRSSLSEGRAWLERALNRTAGAVQQAEDRETAGDAGCPPMPVLRARALNGAGTLARVQGDYEAARVLHSEGLALVRAIGDRVGVANALNNLGLLAYAREDYATAQSLLTESLAIRRELGDREGMSSALSNLGLVACLQEDYAMAQSLLTESLAIKRELGDRVTVAAVLINLGLVTYRQGGYAAAHPLYAEGLAIRRAVGDQQGTAAALEGLAGVVGALGHAERAAQLLGAAAALREAIGAPLSPAERRDYEQSLVPISARLDPAAMAAAWAAGRALPLDEAIALALAPPAETPAPPVAQVSAGPDALTDREIEVLRLIAGGLSNKEVAERLVLSIYTVQNHLRNIYGKLGVASRSAATRYAWEHHLSPL